MARIEKREEEGKSQYKLKQRASIKEAPAKSPDNKPKEVVKNYIKYSLLSQEFNINEGTGFIYGKSEAEITQNLKIENQRLDGIIEYECYGRSRYFWCYEDLKTEKLHEDWKIEFEN